jgi:hypothetical protein
MGAVCRQVQDDADNLVTTETRAGRFYGWRMVHAAFVLGVFGWGIGFFGGLRDHGHLVLRLDV